MTIGERIKKRRLELDISQDELAQKCGYKSRSSINKIELSRDLPLNKIELMAKALEVTPSYLMGWDEIEWNRKEQQITVDMDYSAEDNILIEAFRNTDNLHQQMVLEILGIRKE